MVGKKLQYRFNIIKDYISKKLSGIKFSVIIGALFYMALLSVLIVNAATAYKRGVENLQKFDEEQDATNELIAENEELKNLFRYYSSIDYKKIYARDNLNLGEKGETLYYIEKNEPLEIEQLKTQTKPREVNNFQLWTKLLFGV